MAALDACVLWLLRQVVSSGFAVARAVPPVIMLIQRAINIIQHTIMAHAHGAGAKANMAKRKLDSLGNLRGASGLANDEQRNERLMNQLNLAKSLAAISKETQSEAAQAKSMATSASLSFAPAAIQKLKEKGGLASCLTMAELRSLKQRTS